MKTYGMKPAALVVTIVVIALGVVDLALVAFGGVGSSVSNFLVNAGVKSPVTVFVFGFVAGHLFGPMSPICPKCGGKE